MNDSPDPRSLHGFRVPATDEWRFGHLDGWLCLDHYVPRRRKFAPQRGAPLPRALPARAFTGARGTRILDENGDVAEEIWDDWRAAIDRDDREPWIGETWLQLTEEAREWAYPEIPGEELPHGVGQLFSRNRGVERGRYSLANGNVVYVEPEATSHFGVLPHEADVPVSTLVQYKGQTGSWCWLEDRVAWEDRAYHRQQRGLLVDKVGYLIQIHHNDLLPRGRGQEPIVGELYTEKEPVSYAALRQGLTILPSLTLKTGYDFRDKACQAKAMQQIRKQRPFCLIVAFPCSVWSSLSNLTIAHRPELREQLEARRASEAGVGGLCGGRRPGADQPWSTLHHGEPGGELCVELGESGWLSYVRERVTTTSTR